MLEHSHARRTHVLLLLSTLATRGADGYMVCDKRSGHASRSKRTAAAALGAHPTARQGAAGHAVGLRGGPMEAGASGAGVVGFGGASSPSTRRRARQGALRPEGRRPDGGLWWRLGNLHGNCYEHGRALRQSLVHGQSAHAGRDARRPARVASAAWRGAVPRDAARAAVRVLLGRADAEALRAFAESGRLLVCVTATPARVCVLC